MDYSSKIKSMLVKSKVSVYDYVLVTKGSLNIEGTLMPRTQGDSSALVIKKSNGYNIGVKPDSIKLLKKSKRSPITKVSFKPDTKKKNIVILGAGGTIASKVDYRTGAVKPAMSAEEIIQFTPGIHELANIKARVLFQMLSECMTPYQWSVIAREAAKEIRAGADGVVIMHGTDVMGYTSAYLSFALQNLPAPVVLVGAQRSSDRASCDTHMNMTCAVKAATSDIAEVMICMHESLNDDYCSLHQGSRVRKCHSSRRDAFKTIGANPFARVKYPELSVEFLRTDYSRADKARKLNLKNGFDERVALLKSVPGMKPLLINSLIKAGYKGIVFEGTGLGHLPIKSYGDNYTKYNVSNFNALKSFLKKGIIFMAPQTIKGRINMSVYETGRDLINAGVIGNQSDIIPETAYVKLIWALGNSKNLEEAKKLMMTNVAGEITERSDVL